MLSRNGTKSLFPRRQGQDCNDGATPQQRIAARKGLLLESSGSFGQDRDLKSDNWEIPDGRTLVSVTRNSRLEN